MRTVVCIKQILDPEIPPQDFAVDPVSREAVRGRAPLVIGPFDLNALEVAMQLKEQAGGAVTIVTVGGPEARDALKRGLAMGGDDAVLATDPGLQRPDPRQTALALAAVVRKLGDVDLVLCGRQSGDWDFGQVGGRLAEALGWPAVPLVTQARAQAGTLTFRQESVDGVALLEAAPPVVAVVTNAEGNRPRLPKVRETMLAGRKPVHVWTAADLGLTSDVLGEGGRELDVVDLFIPPAPPGCEFVEGQTEAEKGRVLARRLLDRMGAW